MKLQHLRDLEIYKHTVDGGSLRSAARVLNLSPAVVSRRIAALEETLGVKLLLRSTRSLQVTPRGEQFYRRCVAILEQVREAEMELSPAPEALQGCLRVSMPTVSSFSGFLHTLGPFLDANPALELELYFSDQPIDARAAGVDVVIRPGPQADSALVTRRLGTAEVMMVAAPAYIEAWGQPVCLDDLLSHRCLRFRTDRQQDLWPLTDADGVVHNARVGGNFFCDSGAALVAALYAGLGIGFREVSEARVDLVSGRLVQVMPAYRVEAFGVYATYPRENRTSRSVQMFLELLADFLGK